MNTRATMLGALGLGMLLGGCPFEEPPIIQDSETNEPTGGTTLGGTSTMSTTLTSESATTQGPTTNGPTTNPTSMGTLDGETTEGNTTEGVTTEPMTTDTLDPCFAMCSGLACGELGACDCGECGPSATCASDQTYCGLPVGFYNDFGLSVQVNGQLQVGFRFLVLQDTAVRQLGVISGGAGATVRMALYDHDGGPANRLVQTDPVMLYANGHNVFDVDPTPIAAGFYWVMLHTEGSTPLRRTFNGDNNYEAAVRTSIPFPSGFPVIMEDEIVLNDYRYNLYMVVED
jgi:hypothetical protein